MVARPVFNPRLYLPLTGGTLTGHLLFSADNTYDIGASGATRPRNIYAGGAISCNGTITNSGNNVQTNGLRFNNGNNNRGYLIATTVDGQMQFLTDGGGNVGVTFDCSTADTLKLHNKAGNATATLQVGTHSALAAETVTGYITIKDYGGTNRKIAVVS